MAEKIKLSVFYSLKNLKSEQKERFKTGDRGSCPVSDNVSFTPLPSTFASA